MFFEYCCYNKNLIEDVDAELMNIFKAIGSGFIGVAVPFHILRQVSQEILLVPEMSVACPIDYPLGAGDKKVRQHESIVALKSGANCIDLTMSPYLFKKKSKAAIAKDIIPIYNICVDYNAELRVIINYELYDQADAVDVCKILKDLGVDTIIPSSGFSNDDIFDNIMFCNILEKEGYNWNTVVDAYTKAGQTEEEALLNARLAYILQNKDYDITKKEIKLWLP